MKKYVFAFIMFGMLASCERRYELETKVYPDGSIDKSIKLFEVDSSSAEKNPFAVSAREGWEQQTEEVKPKEKDAKVTYNITFKKHFDNVEALNKVLHHKSDTLLEIEAAFEKKFRWFYTYYRYSDTYHRANRFNRANANDYLAPEDFAFIDRLPREGASITKADSIFLDQLNTKISDSYLMAAYLNESVDTLLSIMRNNGVDEKSIAKLDKSRSEISKALMNQKDDPDLIHIADSMLAAPASASVRDAYQKYHNALEKRLTFMSEIADGKFANIIEMPGEIVNHNADSVSGSKLFYNPPSIKFLLKDYTLYAESRTMNTWAVIVSVIVVLATVALLVRRSMMR